MASRRADTFLVTASVKFHGSRDCGRNCRIGDRSKRMGVVDPDSPTIIDHLPDSLQPALKVRGAGRVKAVLEGSNLFH